MTNSSSPTRPGSSTSAPVNGRSPELLPVVPALAPPLVLEVEPEVLVDDVEVAAILKAKIPEVDAPVSVSVCEPAARDDGTTTVAGVTVPKPVRDNPYRARPASSAP